MYSFFFYFFYLASKQNKSDHPCLHCDKNSEHIPLKHDFICERLLTCGGINVQFFANLTIAVVSINPYPYECDTFRPNPFVLQSGAFRFAGLAVRTMMCCTSRLKSISVFIYSHCSKKLDSCNNEIILTRKWNGLAFRFSFSKNHMWDHVRDGFASNVSAMIAAAMGALALVPVCLTVQVWCKSVVTIWRSDVVPELN